MGRGVHAGHGVTEEDFDAQGGHVVPVSSSVLMIRGVTAEKFGKMFTRSLACASDSPREPPRRLKRRDHELGGASEPSRYLRCSHLFDRSIIHLVIHQGAFVV